MPTKCQKWSDITHWTVFIKTATLYLSSRQKKVSVKLKSMSMHIRFFCVFLFTQTETTEGKSSFLTASALFRVLCLEFRLPCTENNNTNNNNASKYASLSWYHFFLTKACYKHFCVSHSVFNSVFFLLVAQEPKTGSMSSKWALRFFRSSIQALPPPHPFDVFQKRKKHTHPRIYLEQQGREGDVYTARQSQYQALYTHCTLSQNTVMLEIRMAFHAKRGICCAGDRLVLQTELKWNEKIKK